MIVFFVRKSLLFYSSTSIFDDFFSISSRHKMNDRNSEFASLIVYNICLRTRAPSQKTNLLGGVAQILINQRPSPCLADVGLFVRPKFQQSPSQTKCLPVSSSSHLEGICSIEIVILFTVLQHTPYVKQGSTVNLESSTSSTKILLRPEN